MSIRRKIKRGSQRPPLSGSDKLIYAVLIVLGFASLALIWVFCDLIPTCIARTQTGLVAFRNDAAWISPLLLFLVAAFTPLVAGSYGLERKQPIFGNKRFRPKGLTPMQPVYPLLSREFCDHLSKRDRKIWKNVIVSLSLIFALSLVLLPWGLCPRHTLDDTDTLRTYNAFNRVTHMLTLAEAERLEITIEKNTHRHRSTTYHPMLIIEQDGHIYRLNWNDFPGCDRDEALEHMLHVKSYFADGEYQITEHQRLEPLLETADVHREKLLRELFDTPT